MNFSNNFITRRTKPREKPCVPDPDHPLKTRAPSKETKDSQLLQSSNIIQTQKLFIICINLIIIILQYFTWLYDLKELFELGNKGFLETLGTKVNNSTCPLKYFPHVLNEKLSNVDSAMLLQFIYILQVFTMFTTMKVLLLFLCVSV